MNDIKNFNMENFSNTNNIIIKILWKDNKEQGSLKYYLVSKANDQVYFYDNVEILFDDIYTFDSDLTLQILKHDGKIGQKIKKEKYFHLEERYLFEKIGLNLEAFINLPLSRPINFAEIEKRYCNPNIILQAEINEVGFKELLKKQEQSIQYDANQMYDKRLEKEIEL